MFELDIRPLQLDERAKWQPLWDGYQRFYKSDLGPQMADLLWRRLHDPHEPMFLLGAFNGDNLLGIVHYIFHRSCWLENDSCYLQDLFTVPESRGKGVARSLIDAVAERAHEHGSSKVHWLTHETNATARRLYDHVAMSTGFIQYRLDLG